MEFRQVQYFVCLYEEGSVTRAARRLNIVQPALSMQIAKLEEDIGKPLFVRNPKGMEPTAEARQMYRLFLPVLGDYARAREQVMQTNGELTGQVRVGMIESLAQGVLVDTVLEFSDQHPKVELSLTDGFSGTLTDAVSVGQLDAAIINKPRRSLALMSESIAEEDLLLVTGASFASLPDSVPFQRLGEMKLVLPSRRHGLRGILESFAEAEDVLLQPPVELDSISAILHLVGRSDFGTVLPRVAIRGPLQRGQVQGHLLEAPRPSRHLVCVSHPRRPPSPATAAFVSTLIRHIRAIGV